MYVAVAEQVSPDAGTDAVMVALPATLFRVIAPVEAFILATLVLFDE